MKIERYLNDDGEFRCFVVDNSKVSLSGLTKMIASIPDVIVTKYPRFFDGDIFCEFTYKGKHCTIEEPYGDSTTYDIVTPESGLIVFKEIACAIEKAEPIKGGDWGYNIVFLMRMLVAGLVFAVFLLTFHPMSRR